MVDDHSTKIHDLLYRVFERARVEDEFEFAMAIIPLVRGLPPYGPDNPARETEIFCSEMFALMNAPLEYMTRLRLGLMAYVHMIESKPLYEELSNILWILAGGRAVSEPFGHLYQRRKKGTIPPSAKQIVKFISEQARGVDEPDLADEIVTMLDDEVRNAIVHSGYFFHDGRFHTHHQNIGNSTRLNNGIPLEELSGILVRGATFFDSVRTASATHRQNYSHPKLVQARTGKDGDREWVALLANEEHRLYGVDGMPNRVLVEECLKYQPYLRIVERS